MTPVRCRRLVIAGVLCLGTSIIGCDRPGEKADVIVIASAWPEARRAEFLRSSASPGSRIEWVALDAEGEVGRALDRRGGVDLILGVSPRSLASLIVRGKLRGVGSNPTALWARFASSTPGDLVDDQASSFWRLGDPRDDPSVLAPMVRAVEADGLAKGLDDLARGIEFNSTDRGGSPEPFDQTMAISATGRNVAATDRWIARLVEIGQIEWVGRDEVDRGHRSDLLADLLGATMVDSRPELIRARRSMNANNRPELAEKLFGPQPPWPPASVARLSKASASSAMREDLLKQLVVDAEARAWLDESWSEPTTRVELKTIGSLSSAQARPLILEPRFRAWLRGEWSAWTRQHFRRVARLAEGYRPS